jgi:hypothetical protein
VLREIGQDGQSVGFGWDLETSKNYFKRINELCAGQQEYVQKDVATAVRGNVKQQPLTEGPFLRPLPPTEPTRKDTGPSTTCMALQLEKLRRLFETSLSRFVWSLEWKRQEIQEDSLSAKDLNAGYGKQPSMHSIRTFTKPKKLLDQWQCTEGGQRPIDGFWKPITTGRTGRQRGKTQQHLPKQAYCGDKKKQKCTRLQLIEGWKKIEETYLKIASGIATTSEEETVV